MLEAFERVAEEDEWEEFRQCECNGGAATWLWIFSYSDRSHQPCAREVAVLRYRQLWEKFGDLLRAKLLNGEWVAHGFNPQFGPRPVEIDSQLWRVLEFPLDKDCAKGRGFAFTNLSFSKLKVADDPAVLRPTLHRELKAYIEQLGKHTTEDMTMPQVRDAARSKFEGTHISDYLFAQAWDSAEKPEHFRRRGRPKTKITRI